MSAPLPTPVQITKVYNITSFNYNILQVVLFTSADIFITLVDEIGNPQKQLKLTIQGDYYTPWAGDDNYIINLIVDNVNYFVDTPGTIFVLGTISPPVPPTPTGTTGTTGTTGATGATGTNV
jgi:hypothetical protein